MNGYQDLAVWQRGMGLAEATYRITRSFPKEEQFGLTSQTRRAAASIPANIAEGYGRGTRSAYVSFVRIAQGSLRELETHLILAQRLGFCSAEDVKPLLEEADELGRMIRTLIGKLNTKP